MHYCIPGSCKFCIVHVGHMHKGKYRNACALLVSCTVETVLGDWIALDALYKVFVSADLLADLSASQLLAQADLAECNSPLKIVQIGGDDLFESDETVGHEFLLDTEAGMP